MRRGKGLLITIIVIIILLVIALVSLVLYKFVFNKDGKKSNSQGQIEIEQPISPEDKSKIEVGDYIAYVPDRAEKYILAGTASGTMNNSSDGIEQEKLNWRVLNVHEDGSIDIISEETIDTEVYFGGALGYNNGVYLLNDICKTLYSNKNLKAKARSINLEDIEAKMSKTAIKEKDNYEYNDITYNDTKTYEGSDAYVPEIHTKKVETESIDYYKEPTKETFIPQEEVELVNTFYQIEDITKDYFEDENFYDLVFGTENSYWLATRCVDCSEEYAIFGLRVIKQNEISGDPICASNNKSVSTPNYIRPVVTLEKSVEILSGSGTKSDPRTIAGSNNGENDEISKIDEDKELVYDAEYTYGNLDGKSYTYKSGGKYSLEDIKVPFINIDTSDAEDANDEIQRLFEAAAKIFEEELEGEKTSYVTVKYEAYENDNTLSISIETEVGASSKPWPEKVYYTYNFDLTDGSKLSYEDIYVLAELSEDDLDEKVEELITKELEHRWKGLAEGYEDEMDEYTEKTIENYKEAVSDDTIKYFLDEDQKLNIIVGLETPTLEGTFEVAITVE